MKKILRLSWEYNDFNYRVYEMIANDFFGNKRNRWFCGYVELKEDNPYYKVSFYKIDIDCHGGLTFGNFIKDEKDEKPSYFIGFDTNHYCDYDDNGKQRWSISECEKECKNIIDQLINLIKDNKWGGDNIKSLGF